MRGTFDTPNASKYVQQLCKHFGHKVEVKFDTEKGQVAFPFGEAVLRATDKQLIAEIDIASPEAAPMARGVIDSHLEKFAFREDFKTMDWDQ